MSSPLSCIISSSLERADMKSSSESMPLLAVVTGVGGASDLAAEAILLVGTVSGDWEDIVASAAFRFRVVGGMVPTVREARGGFPQVETEKGRGE